MKVNLRIERFNPLEDKKSFFKSLTRNLIIVGFVSLFTDLSSQMVFPLIPLYLTTIHGAGAWVVDSDMVRRYCHTSENRLAERLKKIAGVNENEQQVRKYPRCGESNSIHAENCEKCNQILDFKKLTEELEKRKQQQKAVNELENELRKELTILKHKVEKRPKIDNFIMDSLGIIVGEMVHTKGIEAIKELFRKHNVRLAGD